MRKEKFETEKYIYPRGDWRCWVCLREMLQLESFAEDEQNVYLICTPCYTKTARNLRETEMLKSL